MSPYVSGGENAYPAEAEAAYAAQPAIREIAGADVPDEMWGEVGYALCEPAPDATLDDAVPSASRSSGCRAASSPCPSSHTAPAARVGDR